MNLGLYVAQQVINAVSLGSLYALVAIGLSMVFGILRMTNFAHGDMMMVGGFAALVLGTVGLPFWLAALGGIVIAGIAGIVVERVAYRPVRGSPDVTLLLTSLGVTYILENLGILIFTSSPRNFPIPDLMNSSIQFMDGQITFTAINVVTVVLTAVSLAALGWFVTRTDAGLEAFVAAIIGGFGSIAGALVGGYVLGALEVLIVAFLPSEVSPYRDAIVFAFLIAFLLFRPNGLLNRTQEVKL
jgi:branched-chain amino acid transport system permease protein